VKMVAAVFLACLVVSGSARAKSAIPKDVQAFIRNADACEHFAGEFDEGLSKKQQKEIERSVVRYCRPAQKQLKQLSEKYRNDQKAIEIIRSHANDSVTSFR
jgi:hypothetical protein